MTAQDSHAVKWGLWGAQNDIALLKNFLVTVVDNAPCLGRLAEMRRHNSRLKARMSQALCAF